MVTRPTKKSVSTPKSKKAAAPTTQRTPRTATGTSPATPAPAPLYVATDPAAAFAHFQADAQAIPPAKTSQLNIDPDLLVHNVGIAMTAFASILSAVASAVPGAPINLFLELPALALAVLYAADQVIGSASSGAIAQRIASVGALRTPMLAMLEIFASPLIGLADPARVQAIREGKGNLDKAHDAVNIAAYLNELASAIAGKHPFTAAQIAQLAADGQWLVQNLAPAGSIALPGVADPAAVIRDQLWTLLTTRYDALRAACSVVVGLSSLDATIPPLNTRVHAAKKVTPPTAPAAPAPTTPPATTPIH